MIADRPKRHSKRSQIQHDAGRRDEERERAVFGELAADLRSDELDAAQLGGLVLRLQR